MLDKVSNMKIILRKNNKNQNCMLELGLRHNDVADILLELETENYSDTVDDTDFPGEELWEFGYFFNDYELYIKLSLREKNVICISVHEKERPINYPYKN